MARTEVMGAEKIWLQQRSEMAPMWLKTMARALHSLASSTTRMISGGEAIECVSAVGKEEVDVQTSVGELWLNGSTESVGLLEDGSADGMERTLGLGGVSAGEEKF